MNNALSEAEKLQAELRLQAQKEFPTRYFVPNGKQEEFVRGVGSGESLACVFSAGNGIGKTAVLAYILAQIIYGPHGKKNPRTGELLFTNNCPLFEEWPYPKEGRILATHTNLKEGGAIDAAFKKFFLPGSYDREKAGQEYYSVYRFPDFDWTLTLMSYDQDVDKLEGPTFGLIASDEPMPEKFWGASVSRLRQGGIYVCTMTPLSGAGWMFDKAESGDQDWSFTYGDIEDACKQHGVRGHLEHEHIQRMVRSYPASELEARKSGKFMFLEGLVHPDWCSENIVDLTPEQVSHELQHDPEPPTVYMCLDPHEVKPFAITWWAVYPDGRKVCFMEWPDSSCQPYHTTDSYSAGLDDYVRLIKKKEEKINVYKRIGDNYYIGVRRQRGGNGATSIQKELYERSDGNLMFEKSLGQPEDNRQLVDTECREQAIEQPDGTIKQQRLLLADSECRNFDYAMKHWRWSKVTGKSMESKDRIQARPEDRHKCFPNTAEFLLGSGARWVEPEQWLFE